MAQPVTEQDFRLPAFKDADPKDYERREDGEIVLKARWKNGIYSTASLVGLNVRSFEIKEVVDAVQDLVALKEDWCEGMPDIDLSAEDGLVKLRLADGSVLCGATYSARQDVWRWGDIEWEGLPDGAVWSVTKVVEPRLSEAQKLSRMASSYCAGQAPNPQLIQKWLLHIENGHSPVEANVEVPELMDWLKRYITNSVFTSAPELLLPFCIEMLKRED